ncbi:MAG: thiamine diphosphokinase [Clostridiales Family XIII bacterium]|jgi:thiamine pyrophosphokinase|nr:thiamine diphosphokinase [Clostridiales Family XIII bacterium]
MDTKPKLRCIIIVACQSAPVAANVDLRPDDLILCADGGYARAKAENIRPHAIIGDFDSLDGRIGESVEKDIQVVRLEKEKDFTDTLECVKYGIARGCGDFVIVGGLGGRFDHTFANIQTLSFLADMGCGARIADGKNRAVMVTGAIRLDPSPGGRFSVYSYEERSVGVNISGAKYPLTDAVLTQSFPIGVSNEFLGETPVTVSVKRGRLLIILSED